MLMQSLFSRLGERLDRDIFLGSVFAIIALCLPLALFPEQGKEILGVGFNYVTTKLGVFYIIGAVCTLGFLLYLALSKHGDIRLGGYHPEFSTLSWAAMLFCGGIGTSVLYWGTVEWTVYYQAPPFSVAAASSEALNWAVSYPIYHWGIMGWAFYTLPGVAVAYTYYTGKSKSLRLSAACEPLLGSLTRGPLGKTIDLLFVVGLVGACSIGIGLSIPLIGRGATEILGLDSVALGFTLDLVVILIVTSIFAGSVWLGLEKGIRRLSDTNVVLALMLLLFILIVGPTLFIVELGWQGIGHMLQNFVRMSTYTDALASDTMVENWTVFYLAWWLALGPYMGIFITKISRGRSLRQLILGSIGFGTLGCIFFFTVLGNYSIYLELNQLFPVIESMKTQGAPATIVGVLKTLPLAVFVLVLFTLVCIIFAATSYDSASYTLAATATKELKEGEHPERWHRVFWAFLLGLLPITLIYLGGLRPLQSAVVLASVPLYGVMILLSLSLWKSINGKAAPAEGLAEWKEGQQLDS